MTRPNSNQPLRIAMFTEAYPPIISGVAMATSTLVNDMRDLGHEVDMYTPAHPRQPDLEDGVQRLPSINVPVPGWIPLSLPLSPPAFKSIVDKPYDIVHTQHPFLLGTVGRALARRLEIPLVATIHTQYEQYVHYWTSWHETGRWLVRQIVREFCNDCDQLITVAAGMAPVLRSYGVVRPIEIIPNNPGLDKFLNADGAGVRAELGLAPGEFFLLSLGRLAAEKNLIFLLEAVAPLLRGGRLARLVFVGDGPLRGDLERSVEQLGVAERVTFVGAVQHAATARYYAAADLFLMASVTEVNPLTLGEALAAGTPIVAVDSFSAREAITDGVDGLVVTLDQGAFACAVESLMEQPTICRQMGASAREMARSHGGADAAARTIELYRRVAARPRIDTSSGFMASAASRLSRRLRQHAMRDF